MGSRREGCTALIPELHQLSREQIHGQNPCSRWRRGRRRGLLVMLGVPFGRLPGDFLVRRGSVSFYLPLTTSIVLSIVATLLFALFRR